jgi:hypothetical protein
LLGGGMISLPGRNFARFILMQFILFSLIVRTGYQGVQFDMMLKVCLQFELNLYNFYPKNFTKLAGNATKRR